MADRAKGLPAGWARVSSGLYELRPGRARRVVRDGLRARVWTLEAFYDGRWLALYEYRSAREAMEDGR